jgi:hypothetical protein
MTAMTSSTPTPLAEDYRERAAELRRKAARIRMPDIRAQLLRIADDYEALAKQAESSFAAAAD